MKQSMLFEVSIYPELCNDQTAQYNIKESFSNLREAMSFLSSKHCDLIESFRDSEFEELNKSAVFFAVAIMYLDEHQHLISWDEEGLLYHRNGESTPIDYLEELAENDGYLYGIVEGYIRSLIN